MLQGQGVAIPGTVATLNEWSVYLRVSRTFHWGQAGGVADLAAYAARQTPLKGSVEGFVMERLADGNRPAEGVTVSIEQFGVAVTGADGHFRFPEVPEGPHKIALALHELPAEFDVGNTIESALLVFPGKLSRSDFDVVRLTSVRGTLAGPKGVPVEEIVVRMLPGEHYTTPDSDGVFHFYNMRAGTYTFTVDEKTLPRFAVLNQPDGVSVPVQVGDEAPAVALSFEIRQPEKPVRNVLERN